MLDFQIVYTEITMKTITLIFTLAFCWSLNLAAQGVHLSAGDTLSLEFNGVLGCNFTEGSAPTFAGVGNDILGLGESLRLEMFENSLIDSPFATQLYSPIAPATFVQIYGPSAWLDYQGVIRVTMLSGSVDVNYAHFVVSPNVNTFCNADVFAVPEPSAGLLITLGSSIGTVVWICRRRRNRGAGVTP
jgi:hypothetical protein